MADISLECWCNYMQITGILGWKSQSEVIMKLKNIDLIFTFFLVGGKVGEEAGKELGDKLDFSLINCK